MSANPRKKKNNGPRGSVELRLLDDLVEVGFFADDDDIGFLPEWVVPTMKVRQPMSGGIEAVDVAALRHHRRDDEMLRPVEDGPQDLGQGDDGELGGEWSVRCALRL